MEAEKTELSRNLSDVTSVRNSFLEYFDDNGFKREDRVPPTFYSEYWNILLTNSALVRFAPVLQGKERLTLPICLCQPCFKGVSDWVGIREGYLTYFEQLGAGSQNHSKSEAIPLLWSFLSTQMGLDRSQFLVTVFHEDKEMQSAWETLELEKSQILLVGDRNYRRLCGGQVTGAVSAVVYDRGTQQHDPNLSDSNNCGLDCECGRYCEIGDIGFLYAQNGNRVVDFGLGLERLTAVSFKKDSVFEVGELGHICGLIKSRLKGQNLLADKETFVRRLADHLRSAVFSLGEGIHPDNKGNGYVIRRIIRRMILSEVDLDQRGKLIDLLVPQVIETMGVQYPFLHEQQDNILGIILSEERKFLSALDRGIKNFPKIYQGGGTLDSTQAYKLYDTYGLPIEVIERLVQENSIQWNKDDLIARIKK